MTGDPIELAVHRSKLTRQFLLKVVDSVTDEQLAWRPTPRAHSMGWTFWHIARCADALATDIPGPAPKRQFWQREDLTRKWGLQDALLGTNGMGTGVDDNVAATLRPPARDALMDYAKRSFAALDDEVGRLDNDLWCREHTSIFFDGPATVGRSVIASIAHDNRHLGELEYIKGLLGLRGTVTR